MNNSTNITLDASLNTPLVESAQTLNYKVLFLRMILYLGCSGLEVVLWQLLKRWVKENTCSVSSAENLYMWNWSYLNKIMNNVNLKSHMYIHRKIRHVLTLSFSFKSYELDKRSERS